MEKIRQDVILRSNVSELHCWHSSVLLHITADQAPQLWYNILLFTRAQFAQYHTVSLLLIGMWIASTFFDIVNSTAENILWYVFCISAKFLLVGIYLREHSAAVHSAKFLPKALTLALPWAICDDPPPLPTSWHGQTPWSRSTEGAHRGTSLMWHFPKSLALLNVSLNGY